MENTAVQANVPELHTPRLRLRGYAVTDYAPMLAMAQEPDFYRYLGGQPGTPEAVWHRLLRAAGHWALQGYGFWAVEEKASGQCIGAVGLADLRRGIEPDTVPVTPEIGWVLAPAAHSRGYATEAVTAALAWADVHFETGRTMCIIAPDNVASLRLAARFGYREYARAEYESGPIVLLERWRCTTKLCLVSR